MYRLAVICVEFPDVKHNAKIETKDWQETLFSRDTYKNKNNATGQTVYGSLADYYHEISCGALRIEGKVFDWVEVKKNRMDYAPGSGTGNKGPLLTEALEKVKARDGKDALKDFDGLLFLYAGEQRRPEPRQPLLAASLVGPPRRQDLAVLPLSRRRLAR